MELALGAPVTDPQGKSARNSSTRPVCGRRRAVTSEVSWSTVSKRSTVNRAGTATLPVSATRATSFRRRSTIMTFSACSLALWRSCRARTSSSRGYRPRRAVPFIGRSRISSPRRSKNSSGLALATAKRPRSR